MTLASDRLILPRTPASSRYLNQRLPGETPHVDDEFFTDGIKTGTELTVSGTATWTEDHGLLSVVGTGMTVNDAAAYMLPLTAAAAPMTVEAAVEYTSTGADASEGVYVGVGFTDGVISNSQHVSMVVTKFTATEPQFFGRSGTLTSLAANGSTTVGNYSPITSRVYVRTVWTGTNNFEFALAEDGVSWIAGPVGALTPTLTPTHLVVWISHTGFEATEFGLASFHYLRVYDADLSA